MITIEKKATLVLRYAVFSLFYSCCISSRYVTAINVASVHNAKWEQGLLQQWIIRV